MHMAHEYASTLVVKYGGNAMASAWRPDGDPVLDEVAALWASGADVVLVHGGGPEIDAALATRGIVTERIGGMRVTDEPTLAITEAVLCGSINKRIVRTCAVLGIPAVGISGQDAGLLVAHEMRGPGDVDLGYVGEIVATDIRVLRTLLDGGFVPVVAPLAIAREGWHPYNVNADLAAGVIAAALRADAFIVVTDVPRVLRDPNDDESGIDRLTPEEALRFAATDACRSNMKPKVLAAAGAVRDGAGAAYICAIRPSPIASALAGDATTIAAETTATARAM